MKRGMAIRGGAGGLGALLMIFLCSCAPQRQAGSDAKAGWSPPAGVLEFIQASGKPRSWSDVQSDYFKYTHYLAPRTVADRDRWLRAFDATLRNCPHAQDTRVLLVEYFGTEDHHGAYFGTFYYGHVGSEACTSPGVLDYISYLPQRTPIELDKGAWTSMANNLAKATARSYGGLKPAGPYTHEEDLLVLTYFDGSGWRSSVWLGLGNELDEASRDKRPVAAGARVVCVVLSTFLSRHEANLFGESALGIMLRLFEDVPATR